jgi:hypothetical protein
MKIFQTQPYWEQLRNEMVGILEAMVSEHQEPVWEEVRQEAIARLYVQGLYHDPEYWWKP